MTKCYLFIYRMSYSGKAVHRVFANCAQEAFLEGHVHAFTQLGGLPTGQIRYDNLTSAVSKIVFGESRVRVENPRWQLFRAHYQFEPFYCLPGIAGAHEKGGVEQQVGYFRRNYLVPVPHVDSLAELNELLLGPEQELAPEPIQALIIIHAHARSRSELRAGVSIRWMRACR